MSNKIFIGGQAVIEGVMMRGTDYLATAVRKPSGEIVYKKTALKKTSKSFYKMPLLRGIFVLFDSLVLGIKELTFSASQADTSGESEGITNKEAIITTIISLSLGIGLFIVLPSIVGGFFFPHNRVYANLIEATVRVLSFVLYIWFISFSKDIKTVFEYHGAEHKSIYAFENDMELTPENAQTFTTLHPRCGTSFLFIVMMISIIVFSLLDLILPVPATLMGKILVKVVLRILFMPVIAALSYELQRYSSNHLENPIFKVLAFPGLMLQKITTKEPSLTQLEVAIVAIKVSLGREVDNATEVIA